MAIDTEIKFSFYTLACYEFLKRAGALHQAVGTLPPSFTDCREQFDKALKSFLESATPTPQDAVESLTTKLKDKAQDIGRMNPAAGRIFVEIHDVIHRKGAQWDYRRPLHRFHRQGRNAARELYRGSPWPETRDRLTITRPWNLEYVDAVSPTMSYSQGCVSVYFSASSSFSGHLAHAFFFCHEYCSHIYAFDHEFNELFNDGWLMYVAETFFRKKSSESQYPIYWREQGQVFREHLFAQMEPDVRNFYPFVEDFAAWVTGVGTSCFDDLTYELAAFQPQPADGETDIWPSEFLLALRAAFELHRPQLMAMIENSYHVNSGRYSARLLMAQLKAGPP